MANQIKKKYLDQEVISYFDNQIDAVELAVAAEETARIAGDASTLSSANSYADAKVAALVNSAPAVLDTLNELAQALGNDPNFATTVSGQIGSVSAGLAQEILDRQSGDSSTLSSANSYTDAAVAPKASTSYVDSQDAAKLVEAKAYADAAVLVEKNRAESAEGELDGRLDVLEPKVAALEALEHKKFKKTLDAGDISLGYVDLPHQAVAGSTVAFVDRLAIHEGATEDYSVSVVGGVTRITFLNDLVGVGSQKLMAGDNVFVKYVK